MTRENQERSQVQNERHRQKIERDSRHDETSTLVGRHSTRKHAEQPRELLGIEPMRLGIRGNQHGAGGQVVAGQERLAEETVALTIGWIAGVGQYTVIVLTLEVVGHSLSDLAGAEK
jgi:hypothetical protein